MAARLPIAVTMGDPAGCGPKITAQVWRKLHAEFNTPFYGIGDPDLFAGYVPVEIIESAADCEAAFKTSLPILPLTEKLEAVTPGRPEARFANAIIESIETAVGAAQSGEASALVTNPIAKAVLYEAGFKHPGHTEFLAALCQGEAPEPPRPVMMLAGGGLRVALATIHVPFNQVSGLLTQENLTEIAEITHAALQRDFGITSPRLAFTGLNPHAGENGTIGSEEATIINPAAAALRAKGMSISDARPGDTVFHEALTGQFDAVIAMTHDQGLIPVKTLDFWGGVNITLGLPIIRTSPDHGTAYDAAAAGTTRPDSLEAAIRTAVDMACMRGQHG